MHLTKGELLDAYGRMCTIRTFHKEFKDRFATAPESTGEACAAGIGLHLGSADLICCPDEDPALRLGAGAPLSSLLDAGPKRRDPAYRGGPAIRRFTSSPAEALGAAIARRVLSPRSVTVCHLTPDTAGVRCVFDLLLAAQDLALPILFVLPRDARGMAAGPAAPRTTFAGRAGGLGIKVKATPAKDFYAVYHAAAEAVTQARAGRGPVVLETVRTGEDALGYFRRRAVEGGLLRMDEIESADRSVAQDIIALKARLSAGSGLSREARP